MQILFIQENGKPNEVAYHIVNIDPKATGGRYRQLISAQAFTHRQYKHSQIWGPADANGERRFLGYRNLDDTYYHDTGGCFPDVLGVFKTSRIGRAFNPELPVHYHSSLWAFYEHIKYDHRRAILNGKRMQGVKV